MEEKFGTVMIDGKLINIDNLSLEELEKLKQQVDEKEKNIRKKLNKVLDTDNER